MASSDFGCLGSVARSGPRGRRRGATGLGRPSTEGLEARRLLAQVFTVTNILDDTNPGSLRWAIGQVNADTTDSAASPDQIRFGLPVIDPLPGGGQGVWTIAPATPLPLISRPVDIDGYTQPGARPNAASAGDDAVLMIQLDGSNVAAFANAAGLAITAGSSVVRGLSITGFATGIHLGGAGHASIVGDFIGVLPSGTAAAGNTDNGVLIDLSPANTVGGTTPAARNVISGNSRGLRLTQVGSGLLVNGSYFDVVQGNYFGTDRTGLAVVGTTVDNVTLNRSPGATVGGPAAGAGNIIAGGQGSFIGFGGGLILGDPNPAPGEPTSLIQGNFVGTDATGTRALANATGIGIASNTVVLNNLISGNTEGLEVDGSSNRVRGNFIGLDITGANALGNGTGVNLLAGGNTVGGTSPGDGNVISANRDEGLLLNAPSPIAGVDLVEGNYVGTDPSGTKARGNGVGIQSVGGLVVLSDLVSGNVGDGIRMRSTDRILSDFIGVGITGAPLGNGGDGVLVQGGGKRVGGANVESSTIAYNGGSGVGLAPPPVYPTGVAILFNSIHDNARLGIDLGDDGVTPNTPGGPHHGPNLLQNYPVLTAASPSTSTILGTLNSIPDHPFFLQFFSGPKPDPSGFGEGQVYLGELVGVRTDASGNARFTFRSPVPIAGRYVTATAIDAAGDTSEFSKALLVPVTDPV